VLDLDRTDQRRSERGRHLGFRRGQLRRGSGPGADLRRCSGGFCSTERLGRGAGDLGESACKVGVGDSFQREAGKAAGDRPGGRVLRESSGSSIYCTKGQEEGVTRCAGMEEEG
jgi:hypothetical protein